MKYVYFDDSISQIFKDCCCHYLYCECASHVFRLINQIRITVRGKEGGTPKLRLRPQNNLSRPCLKTQKGKNYVNYFQSSNRGYQLMSGFNQ